MARKAKQRISYVLPLADSAGAGGHRLGVNGLAVDPPNSLLYSAGRDGVICAWDTHLDLDGATPPDLDAEAREPPPASTLRCQVQAHTHWINDIALVQNHQALVSASSDVTVKVWRASACDGQPPQTIGLHSDYAKTLAVPYAGCDWVASGGLDRCIHVWDLSGAGARLTIDVGHDAVSRLLSKEKGSVYALAATHALLASGGPEKTARVWDCRTGQRVTTLVGHTDNIRDILVSRDGATIMTASSDGTVKVWSTVAGRCLFTLTMHDASVWSLFSADPDLAVFYSSDRNGMVAKTDTRNTAERDEGLSLALAQEHQGVHKLVAAGGSLWTATSRPSINRWRDVNTDGAEVDVPEGYSTHRSALAPAATARTRLPSPPAHHPPPAAHHPPATAARHPPATAARHPSATAARHPPATATRHPPATATRHPPATTARRTIPLKHVLRLSNTVSFPAPVTPAPDPGHSPPQRRAPLESPPEGVLPQPVRPRPEYSIQGQNGLIKHVMLNDRMRVLTKDTAGEVLMWDLLKCVPVRSYGKRHLEDVQNEVTTTTAVVANWCTVDTRTGSLAVILEENTCFDAEVYADELELDPGVQYREDQRINLGKWVLRYLFDRLVTEEIKRDEAFRTQLLADKEQLRLPRDNAPPSIDLPQSPLHASGHTDANAPQPSHIVRPSANGARPPTTPGFHIGLATPLLPSSPPAARTTSQLPPTAEAGAPLEHRISSQSHRQSSDRPTDYFSTSRVPNTDLTTPGGTSQPPAATPSENQEPPTPSVAENPAGKDASTPGAKGGIFGKKFKMNMSFAGMSKIGRTTTNTADKPAAVEEKENESDPSDTHSSKTSDSRVVDDNLLGTVQKIRFAYEDSLHNQMQQRQAHENGLPVPKVEFELPSAIQPSLPIETPVLTPPPNTTILIQEDRPGAGGVADLFEGTVDALGTMADLVEKAAPMWLGEVLLRNQAPVKDVVKISFILEPWIDVASGQPTLPSIATDGNNRLNANRMLRAKKILAYVAERIEPAPKEGEARIKAEEYLELWCQDQLIPPTMTLASMRTHMWRGGQDILLHYRANGKRPILHAPLATPGIPTSAKPASTKSDA